MNPEAQRIAIAEACGWKLIRRVGNSGHEWNVYESPDGRISSVVTETLPDYLNDLNAMHEAEKAMSQSQKTRYIFELQTLCGGQHFGDNYFATPSQRAEAFLRTLGLWKEDEKK